MQPKDLFIGFLSNLIRACIVAGLTWLAATHPAVGHIVSSSCPEIVVQAAAAFLSAVIVALVGAWMRVLRHNEIIEAAYQEGVSAATGATKPPAPIQPAKLPGSLLVLALCGVMIGAAGCLAPVTVNVLSSRMVIQATGTNAATQSVEGGAVISSNNATATVPLK